MALQIITHIVRIEHSGNVCPCDSLAIEYSIGFDVQLWAIVSINSMYKFEQMFR